MKDVRDVSTWYDLKLGEVVNTSEDNSTGLQRVPGGWLSFTNDRIKGLVDTFIPFDNEFMVNKGIK